jgi:hypothetical protein
VNICIIDGVKYDVIVTEIEESFSVLYGENTGRTIGQGAPMTLDPIGTFFNYKVTFGRRQGKEKEYDELFNFLAKPRNEGIEVNIVHGQALWEKPFKAYVSQGARAVKRIDEKTGKVYWDKFTANIIPIEAQVLPE